MNRRLVAIVILIVSSSARGLYASESTPSHREACTNISKLAREAHTGQQYGALADCYAARRRMFRRKAAEETHSWAVRNARINPLNEKWPRPVDSARNLHDYYEYKASEAARLQAEFNKLAQEATAE